MRLDPSKSIVLSCFVPLSLSLSSHPSGRGDGPATGLRRYDDSSSSSIRECQRLLSFHNMLLDGDLFLNAVDYVHVVNKIILKPSPVRACVCVRRLPKMCEENPARCPALRTEAMPANHIPVTRVLHFLHFLTTYHLLAEINGRQMRLKTPVLTPASLWGRSVPVRELACARARTLVVNIEGEGTKSDLPPFRPESSATGFRLPVHTGRLGLYISSFTSLFGSQINISLSQHGHCRTSAQVGSHFRLATLSITQELYLLLDPINILTRLCM